MTMASISRRELFKAGGALVVSFAFGGIRVSAEAQRFFQCQRFSWPCVIVQFVKGENASPGQPVFDGLDTILDSARVHLRKRFANGHERKRGVIPAPFVSFVGTQIPCAAYRGGDGQFGASIRRKLEAFASNFLLY